MRAFVFMKTNNRFVVYVNLSNRIKVYQDKKLLAQFIFDHNQGETLASAIEYARTMDIKDSA